jgi:hypothetical protein
MIPFDVEGHQVKNVDWINRIDRILRNLVHLDHHVDPWMGTEDLLCLGIVNSSFAVQYPMFRGHGSGWAGGKTHKPVDKPRNE